MGYLDNSGLAYFWGKIKPLINAKAPTSHASTATTYGVANASKYGHAKASGTTPKALGIAAVGSETAAFARGDHVHPLPTAEQIGAMAASDILDKVFPVGIIVPFANTVEPAAIWGGTWELLAEGRTLIQSGSTYPLGSTGGEATHTLTVDEMPSHDHELLIYKAKGAAGGTAVSTQANWWDSVTGLGQVGAQGGGQPHNNLSPYLAVNLWKRTA